MNILLIRYNLARTFAFLHCLVGAQYSKPLNHDWHCEILSQSSSASWQQLSASWKCQVCAHWRKKVLFSHSKKFGGITYPWMPKFKFQSHCHLCWQRSGKGYKESFERSLWRLLQAQLPGHLGKKMDRRSLHTSVSHVDRRIHVTLLLALCSHHSEAPSPWPDATPVPRGWGTAVEGLWCDKATKCSIPPFGLRWHMGEGRVQIHHHIWKQEQLDHPDPGQHSWLSVCHTWTGWRATTRSVVCFASFHPIKNLDSWNPLLVRRVFNQTGVHCVRAWCYNKRCTNQWTIPQFSFVIFHRCLHKQS